MKRSGTRYNVVERLPRRKADKFNKVFNDSKERVRSLWERKDVFYAQLDANNGKQYKYPLQHAATVPQAVTEMQALKKLQREEKLFPPGALADEGKKEYTKECTADSHTIKEAVEKYQSERDRLEKKDPATSSREDSGLKKWVIGFGDRLISAADGKMYKDYALFCKSHAKEKKRRCSGRNIDLGIIAMNHVLDWAITEKWLAEDFRKPTWDTMAGVPEKDRLMEPAEINRLCEAALLDRESLEMLDPRVRHLRAAQSISGQNFHDYLRLLQWTGGREQETLHQRWSNVHWKRAGEPGYLHFPGEEAKAGGGEPAEPRDLTFSDPLEAHLQEMQKRRDPSSDWMFPSERHAGPILSFRRQLERVKKQTEIGDVTFQFFRHWFISQCVMAGIDYKTIAYWVSHRDGGVLIGRLYGHLDKAHPAKMASKLSVHLS
jgi:Phage integrase family